MIGGQALAAAIAVAGIVGAIGSFNALMLSFTRLPVVMAEDGFLPRIFARTNVHTGAPWVAILVCALFWAACYPLGFERSLILDVLLTGLSILLEFWALVALRIREPNLARPYRVPGGTPGAILIGLPPLALILAALVRNRTEAFGNSNELVFGLSIVGAGIACYFLSTLISRHDHPR
jgi:amino acid transporter